MARYLPHLVRPDPDSVHILLVYKNFAAIQHVSHIGLGVAAINNARTLHKAGYWTEVVALSNFPDLRRHLVEARETNLRLGQVPISHVIISAAWFKPIEVAALAREFHDIDFTAVSHSNCGFLSADPGAFELFRAVGDVALGTHNVHLGANCQRLIRWWHSAYHQPMRWLPNMYAIDEAPVARRWSGGHPLRIGAFGALRPLKNLQTAGAAALSIADRVQRDLEFYISTDRSPGESGGTPLRALESMFRDLPNAKLVRNGWASWPDFRRRVRTMDLLLQPSYSESFNMVTADGIAEGVPSVTSDAIDWVPRRWHASVDNAEDIADVGVALLHDPLAANAGLQALQAHNVAGLQSWSNMLLGKG